jgi:hypothetical protein
VHRLAALAEPVHVDDGREVVELVEGRVLERLPHGAFGDLAVAAEHPGAVGQAVELLAGERDSDPVRNALAQRAGGDVNPGDLRRRVPFEPTPELTEGEQLLILDRSRGLEERVHKGRGMALGEDQVVVEGALRLVEVVAQVLGE